MTGSLGSAGATVTTTAGFGLEVIEFGFTVDVIGCLFVCVVVDVGVDVFGLTVVEVVVSIIIGSGVVVFRLDGLGVIVVVGL